MDGGETSKVFLKRDASLVIHSFTEHLHNHLVSIILLGGKRGGGGEGGKGGEKGVGYLLNSLTVLYSEWAVTSCYIYHLSAASLLYRTI